MISEKFFNKQFEEETIDLTNKSPEEIRTIGEDLKNKLSEMLDFIEKHKVAAFSVLTGLIAAAITKITNNPDSAVVVGAVSGFFIAGCAKIASFLEGKEQVQAE